MQLYQQPSVLPRSRVFQIRVNGRPLDALHTDVADFAVFAPESGDFPVHIEVVAKLPAKAAALHPRAKRVPLEVSGSTLSWTLERPEKLSLQIEGAKPLYVFCNSPENNPPAPGAPDVVTVVPGEILETPLLTLEPGQTLYLPGGSVFKGRIHAKGAAGVRICGHGIFDGSYYDKAKGQAVPSIILERCDGCLVEDITMVRPQGWMLMLAACRGATVRHLKQIGEVMSSDGIDVVGSRDVLIEDCFLHNNDDCVVVKAFFVGAKNLDGTAVDARENVDNVLVRRCTFANWTCGNGMEIGHELSVGSVRNITFQDIDVLHVHGTGAVFSIHNFDRALVENVVFEDIRIEHCYDKFIDFRISRSRFSTDAERGRVRGVILRRIHWQTTPANAGYTVSMVGGWDKDHLIEDVQLQDIFIDGRRVEHLDELEITTRHCHGLRLV